METIIYQGELMSAKLIFDPDGFDTLSTRGMPREGKDKLYRDLYGQYYLKRVTWRAENGGQIDVDRFEAPVHRLSIRAVALFVAGAVTNSRTLRSDIAGILADGSLVIDAGCKAMALSDETMAKVAKFARMTSLDVRDIVEEAVNFAMVLRSEDDDGTGDVRLSEVWGSFCADVQDARDRRLAVLDHGQTKASAMKWNTCEDLAEGGMVVCLHLKPEPARLLRAACLLDEKGVIEFIYDELSSDIPSAITGVSGGEEDQRQIFADNASEEDEPSSGIAVRLDMAATELVQRYLEATPRDYTVGDFVNGAVIKDLKDAIENLGEAEAWGALDGDLFHDGPWGYTENEIMRAQFRRENRDPAEIDAMHWSHGWPSNATTAPRPLQAHDRNPQPDYSLNAAAPEPVEAPPEAPKADGETQAGKEEA